MAFVRKAGFLLPQSMAIISVLVLLSLASFFLCNARVQGHLFDSMYYFGNGNPAASDGLLMVDHLASAFHLPSPSQHVKQDKTLDYDVTTAMNTTFFMRRGIKLSTHGDDHSLEARLGDFAASLPSICSSHQDCEKKFERAIFVLDQIGNGDYKHAFLRGKTLKEAGEYVPHVVQGIENTIKKLIGVGARNLLVSGSLPMGCLPGYLTLFQEEDKAFMQYDAHKCLLAMNTFARLHNDRLRMAVSGLKKEHPQVHIVYADTYMAFTALLRNHLLLGFKKGTLMKACCGTGGSYNFDPKKMCGKQGLPVCLDPSTYLHWDGFHLTQEAMKLLVDAIMRGKGYLFPEMISH